MQKKTTLAPFKLLNYKTMKKLIQFSLIAGLLVTFLWLTPSCGIFSTPKNPDSTQQTVLGDTLWSHQLTWGTNELWINEAPLALGKDGSIYYTASGGQSNWEAERVYALNKTDGSLKWKTEPLAIWHLNSDVMVGDDGTIYVESYTKLYSIDPSSGSFNWVWEVPQTLPGSDGNDVNTYGELGNMALANNGNIITKTTGSGSYYRALYCIGTDGTMKWHRFIGSENNPITIGYQGTIYDYEHDNNGLLLTASNPATGALIWSIPSSIGNGNANIAIADNGDLILHIANDTIVRIDPNDNHTIWKTVATMNYKNKVISAQGFLYLFDQWAGTSMFDIQSGNVVGTPVSGIPSSFVIDSKEHLIGYIFNLRHVGAKDKTGKTIWESKVGAFGKYIAISDEKIVYTFHSKTLYAIQSDAAMTKSNWPRFSHDNRNTFNFSKW